MEVTAKYGLDITDLIEGFQKANQEFGNFEARLKQTSGQKQLADLVVKQGQFNQSLGQQVQIYQRVEGAATSFRNEQKRLETQLKDLKSRQLEFLAAGRYGELRTEIGKVEAKLREMGAPLKETDSLWDKLKAKFSGGLKIPKIEVPDVPKPNGRDDKGRFVEGKKDSVTSAVLDGIGDATGIPLSNLDSKTVAIAGGVAAIGTAVFKSIQESAKFGKALSELSAITGVTGKDLQYLADQATDLETKTGIAATDIVEGFKLVGSIKPELLGSKEALAQVTDEIIALSQASGLSLADAATAGLGALNQFGEGADQAGRFVNVLAAGAKFGASEINDTAEALKNSGTAIKAAGVSFEQGNALIQSLAGVMIKGSEAGTALRNVLLKLETASDKNLRPSVVGLDAALENASKKFTTTTDLTKTFGVENIIAARRILDTRGEISKMTADLTGTSVAYDQQRTSLNNLATDLSKAGTAITGLFRSLGQSQDGFIRNVVQGFTTFVQQLSNAGSVTRTFLSSLTDGQGGVLSAFRDAARVSEANDIARKKGAETSGIKTAATQGVADDTKALADLYAKQGQTVPKAQRAAADKVKAQSDQAYADAVADHNRLRKELERSTKDQKSAFDAQFDESRRNLLRTKTAKSVADGEVTRLAKADAERAKALASALGEAPSEEEKKAGEKAQKIREDNYKLLLSAQAEYTKEYQKLEADFGKDRLEALKKDENAYLLEKAKLDKAEVDAEQAHLLKLLQLAASNKTQINKQTGQREIIANTSVQLPKDLAEQFNAQRIRIDEEAARQIKVNRIRQELELLELGKQSNDQELRLFDKKWEGILLIEKAGSEKYLALEKKRDADRQALQYDQIIRDQKAIESINLAQIAARSKGANETGSQFNRRNQLDEIASQQFSAENQIYALQGQNNPANNPEIARLEAYVKALKDKRKEIDLLQPTNRDIFDLLGISKSFADETERTLFLNSVQQISEAIQQTTQLAIQSSEERIQALDSQIQAKEQQVSEEESRDKEGYANNLALRRKELEDLKRQKADEEQVKRRALAVQQALDLASQISNNAVTVSNTVTAISEMFKQYGKIPLVGIFLALGAVATIIATIASVKAKAQALTQLREGGRIPRNGRTHQQGGHRIEGTDIEVERGEHVINARSSDKYDEVLDAINKDNPHRAFSLLMQRHNFGLPPVIIQHLKQPGFGTQRQTLDTSRLEKQVASMGSEIRELKNHIKGQKQYVALTDGRVMTVDGNKTTYDTPKK